MNRLFAVATLLLAVGCTKYPIVSLSAPPKPLTADEYDRQLRRWTRYGIVRRDVDTDLMVTATMHSPEFRSAFVARSLEIYKVVPEAQPGERARLDKEVDGWWEFHIESTAHKFDVNELTGKRAAWRVTLVVDDEHERLPAEVRADRLRRTVEPTLYPYADDFTRGWRIRFPTTQPDGTATIPDGARTVALRFAGPPGATDLVWQLRK